MPRLVDLYPRAWRDRYGAEFDDLLAERPAGPRDRLDIVLGAFDAWIHPQVAGPTAARPAAGRSAVRLPAVAAAVLGGVLMIVAAVGMQATAVSGNLGYKEVNGPFLALILGMVLVSVAAIVGSPAPARAARPGSTLAVVMLVGALLTATPWPVLVIGFLGFAFASALFGVVIAFRDHRPLGIPIAIGSLILTSLNTEDERSLLAIPIALVWILVGLAGLRVAPAPASRIAIEPLP